MIRRVSPDKFDERVVPLLRAFSAETLGRAVWVAGRSSHAVYETRWGAEWVELSLYSAGKICVSVRDTPNGSNKEHFCGVHPRQIEVVLLEKELAGG